MNKKSTTVALAILAVLSLSLLVFMVMSMGNDNFLL